MITYRISGRDVRTGERVEAQLQAHDERHAREVASMKGLVVDAIEVIKAAKTPGFRRLAARDEPQLSAIPLEPAPVVPYAAPVPRATRDPRGVYWLLVAVSVGIVLFIASAVMFSRLGAPTVGPPLQQVAPLPPAELSTLYTVQELKTSPMEGSSERTIYVSLPRRLAEAELRAIADELRQRHGQDVQRLFVYARLDGRDPKMGAWATADSDQGSLKLDFYGMSEDEFVRASAHGIPPGATLIGKWEIEGVLKNVRTIYEQDGQCFQRDDSPDAAGTPALVLREENERGVRFTRVGTPDSPNESGSHCFLLKNGALEMHENASLLWVCLPIEVK